MAKTNPHTILITGANGFVGRSLVEELIKTTKHKLVLNVRKTDKNQDGDRITFVECVLNDFQKIEETINFYKPETIFHLGALARLGEGEQKPNEAFKTNYLATKNLIDLSIKLQVKKFIFVSTDMAREHKSVVGITKYLTEAYIQKLSKPSTQFITVRLPNISWTPGSVHLIFERLIREKKAITVTDDKMSRRFISGNEAAKNIIYAFETGKDKDIFAETREPEKITDLAKAMITESGKEIEVKIIGMRPGEKLSEKSYDENEIEHTSFKHLALLKSRGFEPSEINEAIVSLQQKPGFTTEIKND